jgi:glucuronyl/N-acetylglucosaminyl transferase EXT1
VPRGRRVGTFRFIEALKSACIPVVLSNNWVFPFRELIDWKQAAFQFDEDYLSHVGYFRFQFVDLIGSFSIFHLQIPFTLREISFNQIFQMRKECLNIYKRYFSSYEAILNSTIQIIKNRIYKISL